MNDEESQTPILPTSASMRARVSDVSNEAVTTCAL